MLAFLDTIEMALGTLRGNVLRSILTLLGLVIAAATVVKLMTSALTMSLPTVAATAVPDMAPIAFSTVAMITAW